MLEEGVLVVGDARRICIGDEARIFHRAVITVGRRGHVSLGSRTHLGVGTYLNATEGTISLGSDCAVSNMVQIYSYSNWPDGSSLVAESHRVADVRIGDNVLIGAGAIILPGVEIGHNSVVGAGAVVTRAVEAGTVVAGIPARVLHPQSGDPKVCAPAKSQANWDD